MIFSLEKAELNTLAKVSMCEEYKYTERLHYETEQIDQTYGRQQYLGETVVVIKQNGYVNVSNIAKKNRRDLNEVLRDENVIEVKNILQKQIKDSIFVYEKNDYQDIMGTYAHPKITLLISSILNQGMKIDAFIKFSKTNQQKINKFSI